MTYAEFQQAAWSAAPPIRKRVVGRETFNELLDAAVRSWSAGLMDGCLTDDHRQQYARDLLERVRSRHQVMSGQGEQEYGFIWVFLLSAVASALIQWLIKRWLDRHFTADMLQAWHQEMAP